MVILLIGCPIWLYGQVNQFDISDEQYAEADLVMDKDSDGYVVMVWTDMRDAWYFNGDEDHREEGAVYGQIYDQDLNPVGNNFRISKPLEGGTTGLLNLDLLVLQDGRFIVTWQQAVRTDDGDLQNSIQMAVLNRQGEILISQQAVNTHKEVHQSKPQISMVPDNRFLITWSDRREEKRYRYGQYYNAETGEAIDGNVRLGPDWLEPVNFRQYMISEERYLLIYDNRYMQYYDQTDTPVGEMINIVETYDVDHERLSIFHPFGTDSLFVFHGSKYNDQMSFSFADPDGTPRSEPVLINDNDPLQMNSRLRVAINEEDGSFMFVWEDRRNSAPSRMSFSVADIYAQRYNPDAEPIGSNFKVNHESREKNQMTPQVLHHFNNQYLITWWENRLLTCPSPGEVVVNRKKSFQMGLIMDFYDPVPGEVHGWESYVEYRNEFYRSNCSDFQPEESQLIKNYPNPFNNTTTLVFELNVEDPVVVEIQIYDITGRLVKTLQPGEHGIGRHEVSFDATGLASGMYIARLVSPQMPDFQDTVKLLLSR